MTLFLTFRCYRPYSSGRDIFIATTSLAHTPEHDKLGTNSTLQVYSMLRYRSEDMFNKSIGLIVTWDELKLCGYLL
jgi:hypothetical protein